MTEDVNTKWKNIYITDHIYGVANAYYLFNFFRLSRYKNQKQDTSYYSEAQKDGSQIQYPYSMLYRQ